MKTIKAIYIILVALAIYSCNQNMQPVSKQDYYRKQIKSNMERYQHWGIRHYQTTAKQYCDSLNNLK